MLVVLVDVAGDHHVPDFGFEFVFHHIADVIEQGVLLDAIERKAKGAYDFVFE